MADKASVKNGVAISWLVVTSNENIGGILAEYWQNIGGILVEYWWNIGGADKASTKNEVLVSWLLVTSNITGQISLGSLSTSQMALHDTRAETSS